jgi:hypothetical protein
MEKNCPPAQSPDIVVADDQEEKNQYIIQEKVD